jgi:hypothetical protein
VKYAGVLFRSGAGAEHVGRGSYSFKDATGTLQTGSVRISKNP